MITNRGRKSSTNGPFNCLLLFFYAKEWPVSWLDYDMWRKLDYLWQPTTSHSGTGLRPSITILSKGETAPKKGYGFWIRGNHYDVEVQIIFVLPEKTSGLLWRRHLCFSYRFYFEPKTRFCTCLPHLVGKIYSLALDLITLFCVNNIRTVSSGL